MKRLPTLSALVLLSTMLIASPAMASNAPIRVSFDKSLVDPAGVWEGTVSGAAEGDLTTHLLSLDETGVIWHVSFEWKVVADDPTRSFVAHTDGILNTRTGRVVMNGTVESGWMQGARVHEEGQLIDAATDRCRGEITILPATS